MLFRSTNAVGDSGYSNTSTATTLSGAPNTPSGLSAASVSATQINLAWTDNSNNETGFKVERSTDGGANFTPLFTTAANAVSFNDSGLNANSTLTYRVRAANGSGDSAASNSASATTWPLAPTGLLATAVSASQIDLNWTDTNTGESGTHIERSTDGVIFSEIATVSANVNTYSNTGLSASTPYTYRVRAYNGGGNSAYSAKIGRAHV